MIVSLGCVDMGHKSGAVHIDASSRRHVGTDGMEKVYRRAPDRLPVRRNGDVLERLVPLLTRPRDRSIAVIRPCA